MIGLDIRAKVFRDTKNHYSTFPKDLVARPHIRFVQRYAGKSILDLGCATGNYCRHFAQLGYTMIGADVNEEYVRIARERGVDARLIVDKVPLDDASCDTVLLSEVLEHVPDPAPLLAEARRIARKNVLVTVPNSGDVELLQQRGVIYEHFADLDHKNFFTEESLGELLRQTFPHARVWKGDGLSPLGLFPGRIFRLGGEALIRARLLRPAFYFRLYAVADVN
jgi:SAM-dependent methyltransferase